MYLNKCFKFLLWVLLSSLLGMPIQKAQAIDEGDWVVHAAGMWNQDLKAFQSRLQIGRSFWDEFSVGPAYEHNQYFDAYGFGLTWHLEPFEISSHAGILFWDKDRVRRSAFQVSLHAHYLIQVTTHSNVFATAGVNLPEKFFRGVPLGLGVRYWY